MRPSDSNSGADAVQSNGSARAAPKKSGNHLSRYRQIGHLLWKYGRGDLAHQLRNNDDFEIDDDEKPLEDGPGLPKQLADDLEAMGPTYIKLGQVLAGRPDLLPAAYLSALSRLQDRVTPFPYAEVERIVQEELGARISKAFARFDTEPMAVASLGQVHYAELRDGRPVVVKVQRPHIRQQIADDFKVLRQIAGFLDSHTTVGKRYGASDILEEFRETIHDELDYEREALNLTTVADNLAEFELIRVPRPIAGYSTRHVLTMEYVRGSKITELSPLLRLELDGGRLCKEVLRAYLKQVLVDGLFHADPHPGNVLVTDSCQVALIDLGMVGHVSAEMQENLLKLVLALSEGRGEDAADIVVRAGTKLDEFDEGSFRRQVSKLVAARQNQALRQLNIGQSMLDMTGHARDCGLRVPSELTLLGKTLLQLDEVGRVLDPTFDPAACIREYTTELMKGRMRKEFTQVNVFNALLELKQLATTLPRRINRLVDTLVNSEFEVKFKAVDAAELLQGMQKIANRITTGVVLASLIIGASLLMRVETKFRLWGYPGLAILCFVSAAAGGFWLVLSILIKDRETKKKTQR